MGPELATEKRLKVAWWNINFEVICLLNLNRL
jgi:hypothetical protein